jgi:hypothetical protein
MPLALSSNVDNAYRLKGDLLLVVVNQLVKHDRDFDLLYIPGAGHGSARGRAAEVECGWAEPDGRTIDYCAVFRSVWITRPADLPFTDTSARIT